MREELCSPRQASSSSDPLNIFISYRRSESSGYSGRLYDRLCSALPNADVFIDVERIDPGIDWRAKLSQRIEDADVVLVVIGEQWRTLADAAGRRRLDDPSDVTRWELETALARGKRLVPVLLQDAAPLYAAELPPPLQPLAALQAVRIRHDAFDAGVEDLIARLTGKRLRDEARRARGRWLTERAKRWGIPAIALAALLLAWIRLFDLLTLDTRIATWTLALADVVAPLPLAEDIVLVGISADHDAAAPGMRARYGELVSALARAGARRAVFDIHFHERRAEDGELAAALRSARATGLQVFVSFIETSGGKPRSVAEIATEVTALGLACAGRRLGYALSIPIAFDVRTSGSETRVAPLPALSLLGALGPTRIVSIDGEDASLVLEGGGATRRLAFGLLGAPATATQACKAIEPGSRAAELLLRISAAGTMRARRSGFDDVLAGRIESARFAGKTVVIGYETPVETFRIAHGLGREKRFGYELQADAINTIGNRRIVRFVEPAAQLVVAGIFATLGAAIGVRCGSLGARRRAGLLTAVVAGYAVAAVMLAAHEDLLLNSVYDLGAFALAYAMFRTLARRWLQ